jgi:hypothetical protein
MQCTIPRNMQHGDAHSVAATIFWSRARMRASEVGLTIIGSTSTQRKDLERSSTELPFGQPSAIGFTFRCDVMTRTRDCSVAFSDPTNLSVWVPSPRCVTVNLPDRLAKTTSKTRTGREESVAGSANFRPGHIRSLVLTLEFLCASRISLGQTGYFPPAASPARSS